MAALGASWSRRAFRSGIGYLCTTAWLVTRAEGIPEPDLILYGEVRNNAGGQNVRVTSGTLVWSFEPLDGGAAVVQTAQLTNLNDQFSFILRVPCESESDGLTFSEGVLRIALPAVSYKRTNVTLNGTRLYLRQPAQEQLDMHGSTRGLIEQVDLAYAVVEPDSDGDGLPDWWEALYPEAGDPDVDFDGDGLNNQREYVAGTNPLDPASVLEFVEVEPAGERQVVIRWSSAAGRSYTLLRSAVLSTDPADYAVVESGIAGTPPGNAYQDTLPIGMETFFYRVRVD